MADAPFVVGGTPTLSGAMAIAAATRAAAAEDAAAALAALQDWAERQHQVSGEFVQREQRGDGRVRELQGVFAFARPDRFRWEVTAPFAQVTVSDGREVITWDADLQQATVAPLDSEALRQGPLAVLVAPKELPRWFALAQHQQEGYLRRWRLQPLSQSATVRAIEITLADDRLHTVRIEDAFGQVSEIVFRSYRAEVPPHAFVFSIPVGATVVRSGR